jgi:hypothetical protein
MDTEFRHQLFDLRDRALAGQVGASSVASDVFLAGRGRLEGAFGEIHQGCAKNCSEFGELYDDVLAALEGGNDYSANQVGSLAIRCDDAEKKLGTLKAQSKSIKRPE